MNKYSGINIVMSALIIEQSRRKERKFVNEVDRKDLIGDLKYECSMKIQSQLKIKGIAKM